MLKRVRRVPDNIPQRTVDSGQAERRPDEEASAGADPIRARESESTE